MKIYSLNGTTGISDEDHGTFEPDQDGGFDVPAGLGERLVNTHFAGLKVWETEGERSTRLVNEEEARRRDPATLLAAVETLVAAQNAQAEAQAQADAKKAPAKKSAKSKE